MNAEKLSLRPTGKGFIVTPSGNGMPAGRCLVETFTGTDKKKYIKLNGDITPLLPSHMFLAGN